LLHKSKKLSPPSISLL
jgi:hypothetical protein